MEKFPNNDGNIERARDSQEALGEAALEQQKFNDYIVKCADILGDFVHQIGYYEPEDGDTREDALAAGLEERIGLLSADKGAIYNLFRNDIDLRRVFSSGCLEDFEVSMSSYEDTREGQILESIRILGNDYFGENIPQEQKDLMKSILYGEMRDDGTDAGHWDLTDEQRFFLESKNDVISWRLLVDREGLSSNFWLNSIHELSWEVNEFGDIRSSRELIEAKRIIRDLEQVQRLIDKRKTHGIDDGRDEESVKRDLSEMKDKIDMYETTS